MKLFLCLAVLPLATTLAHNPRNLDWIRPHAPKGVVSGDFPYTFMGKQYSGFYALPADGAHGGAADVVPGMLIGHQWMGLGEMERYCAEQAAGWGYAAFALDVYGTGVRPTTPAAARAAMAKAEANLTWFHAALYEGVALLKNLGTSKGGNKNIEVNATALFANGYCFGGQMVLELARTGREAGLLGVASFHGELGNLTSLAEDRFTDRCGVMVHHADLDYQPASALLAWESEVRSHGVRRWSATKWGNCQHGWTDPTQTGVYRPLEADAAHDATRSYYALLAQGDDI